MKLTVAAKDFTEQLILGNMLSTILSTAGADVTNLSNTPGSFGVRQAVLKGDVDISPEYTGTGWINYLGNAKPIKGSHAQYEAVLKADKKNGLTWLPPAPMNNTYAFAIRESQAKQLGITKLSRSRSCRRSELTFCVETEFAKRNDGFQPMLKTYGIPREQDQVDQPRHRRHLHRNRGRQAATSVRCSPPTAGSRRCICGCCRTTSSSSRSTT